MSTVDDYGTEYTYEVEKDGLILVIQVWPYESVIGLTLRVAHLQAPFLRFVVYVQGEARYTDDKRGECLELGDCLIAPSSTYANLINSAAFPYGQTIRIAVQPHLRILYDG